jgi:hypothetical protein
MLALTLTLITVATMLMVLRAPKRASHELERRGPTTWAGMSDADLRLS